MNIRFFRCLDCLTVFTVDYQYDQELWEKMGCACGGHIEDLGMVKQNRLVKTYETTPCDDRCTCALGPACSCSCGGRNHGTMKLIKVTLDCGPVPPVNLGVKSVELGKAFRDLYDKANASWRKKYGAITEKKDRGYLPRPEWDFYYEGLLHHRKLWKIRNMKRYGLRHKHLLKFIEETK